MVALMGTAVKLCISVRVQTIELQLSWKTSWEQFDSSACLPVYAATRGEKMLVLPN